MSDFSTPFGKNGPRRLPTEDEKINGFPCGPADPLLFNGLVYRLEAEVGEVISKAGLTPKDSNTQQLREAIEALISTATGGGDTAQFLRLDQARNRLPIYPEIETDDGKIPVISPSLGVARMPAEIDFVHRGIFPVTTEETDFATTISRTYHLRWNPTNGFTFNDLTDVDYNPDSLSEDDESFDSTFDDMLISRVISNSSNVLTITNLSNKNRLIFARDFDIAVINTDGDGLGVWATLATTGTILDWARTPQISTVALSGLSSNAPLSPQGWSEYQSAAGEVGKIALRATGVSRYGGDQLEYTYDDSVNNDGRCSFTRTFLAG